MATIAPSNVAAKAASTTTLTVTWTNGQVTHDNNKVEFSANGTDWTTASAAIAASATSYTITSLTAGTKYWVRVQALKSGDNSTVTNATPTYTIPNSIGVYAAYRNTSDAAYTHHLHVTGIVPFAEIAAINLGNGARTGGATATDYFWGAAITTPSIPTP